MRKATDQQLNKMKELNRNSFGKQNYELRALFSHFLQILSDVDSLSQFKQDFNMKLIKFDYQNDKSYIINELKELMKSSIEYYSEN